MLTVLFTKCLHWLIHYSDTQHVQHNLGVLTQKEKHKCCALSKVLKQLFVLALPEHIKHNMPLTDIQNGKLQLAYFSFFFIKAIVIAPGRLKISIVRALLLLNTAVLEKEAGAIKGILSSCISTS